MQLFKYTFRCIFYYDGNFKKTELELLKFKIINETKSGYWIKYSNNAGKKWVPKKCKNAFAFVNEKDALINFIHRKRRQIAFIRFNLNRIKEAKVIAENLLKIIDNSEK